MARDMTHWNKHRLMRRKGCQWQSTTASKRLCNLNQELPVRAHGRTVIYFGSEFYSYLKRRFRSRSVPASQHMASG